MSPKQRPGTRTHVVLVPGFGGFDALGQIRYYAGLTPVFLDWCKSRPSGSPSVVLHYFDNLPTAAVSTRAARLLDYLAKRIVRREFQSGDSIVLVGHSTGGLDIRRLLWELARQPKKGVPLDGLGEDDPHTVKRERILEMIQRVVFLSVPQYGTNIANWVVQHTSLRRLMMNSIRDSVAAHPARRPVAFLQDRVKGLFGNWGDADLLRAAHDAMEESDDTLFADDPKRAADAREAYSELRLWTQHTAADFGAIEDLGCRVGPPEGSPAHFDQPTRDQELTRWREYGIATRSYATVGWCPFDPRGLRSGRVLSLVDPRTWPEFGLNADARQRTDVVYRLSYRVCAVGSFVAQGGQRTATLFGTEKQQELEDWDNDGIVNTASMLWPDGPATRLVHGDHGDIIGHYQQVPCSTRPGRRFSAYDLLRSGSGFGHEQFRSVWRDVLEFCGGEEGGA
jgi:triacylglycerol lipase